MQMRELIDFFLMRMTEEISSDKEIKKKFQFRDK